MKPFEEIVRFVADAAGAEKLSAFKPSQSAEKRVAGLLAKQQAGTLREKEAEGLAGLASMLSILKLGAQVKAAKSWGVSLSPQVCGGR